VGGFSNASPVTTVGFGSFDTAALRAENVRIYPGETAANDLEPRYIAVSPDGTKAMVTLQEANAVAILDIATAAFDDIVSLGTKDYSTLLTDFSDRDGLSNGQVSRLKTDNPVSGFYMPDGVASFTQGGSTYYLMANEGDDRNDVNLAADTDTVRVSALDLADATFPTETTLKLNANLGRLTVANKGKDGLAQTSPVTELFALGGRSFSIRNSAGALVYDSKDLIERTIATYGKNDGPVTVTNTVTNAIADDTRSDNKAAEPEGVAVATIGRYTACLHHPGTGQRRPGGEHHWRSRPGGQSELCPTGRRVLARDRRCQPGRRHRGSGFGFAEQQGSRGRLQRSQQHGFRVQLRGSDADGDGHPANQRLGHDQRHDQSWWDVCSR